MPYSHNSYIMMCANGLSLKGVIVTVEVLKPGILQFGSSSGLVALFTFCMPPQCIGTNNVSSLILSLNRLRTLKLPLRDVTSTHSPSMI